MDGRAFWHREVQCLAVDDLFDGPLLDVADEPHVHLVRLVVVDDQVQVSVSIPNPRRPRRPRERVARADDGSWGEVRE